MMMADDEKLGLNFVFVNNLNLREISKGGSSHILERAHHIVVVVDEDPNELAGAVRLCGQHRPPRP